MPEIKSSYFNAFDENGGPPGAAAHDLFCLCSADFAGMT
jgi:hypothetical protein